MTLSLGPAGNFLGKAFYLPEYWYSHLISESNKSRKNLRNHLTQHFPVPLEVYCQTLQSPSIGGESWARNIE